MSNFITNEIVSIDDRGPSWINNKIKSLIKNKTEHFKYYFELCGKFAVSKINHKCYWSILKSFLNNKNFPA